MIGSRQNQESGCNEPKRERQVPLNAAVGTGIIILLAGFVVGDRWEQIKYRFVKPLANSGLPQNLDYAEVEEVYDVLRRDFDGDLNVDDLLDGMKEGLAQATGDPYTVYFNEEEAAQFLDGINGSFTGIGAELGLEDERLIIVSPLKGFPAESAGLRAKDIIVEINGEDTLGIKVEEAISKIRGPAGTDVTLGIVRLGAGQQFDVTITRAEITTPSVTSKIEDGIGIIAISTFGEDTVRLAKAAAADFINQGIDKVVLDLRNNSGGYLNGAVQIAGLWLDGNVVVETRRGDQVTETKYAPRAATLKGLKTVVLINEGSASASEIVAGALKDHKAATLVGTTSYGKGKVQDLEENLLFGGTLKVTIARWYTPNGSNIDEYGITPDVKVELTEADIKADKDPQLSRALKLLQ